MKKIKNEIINCEDKFGLIVEYEIKKKIYGYIIHTKSRPYYLDNFRPSFLRAKLSKSLGGNYLNKQQFF